jgi:hypothetical protein
MTLINQIKVLSEIFQQSVSSKKIPMIVVDQESASDPKQSINARIAAVKGFSSFASAKYFLIDQNSTIRLDLLKEMQILYEDTEVFFFGFTFVIWNDLLDEMEKEGVRLSFPKATLIHGGGWKKMLLHEVENTKFNQRCTESLGVSKIFNYYGMVEQTGSIFFDCEKGYLHSNPLNDVLIRSPLDFSLQGHNQSGLIQVFAFSLYSSFSSVVKAFHNAPNFLLISANSISGTDRLRLPIILCSCNSHQNLGSKKVAVTNLKVLTSGGIILVITAILSFNFSTG